MLLPSVGSNIPKHFAYECLFSVEFVRQFVGVQEESEFLDGLLQLVIVGTIPIGWPKTNLFMSDRGPLLEISMPGHAKLGRKDRMNTCHQDFDRPQYLHHGWLESPLEKNSMFDIMNRHLTVVVSLVRHLGVL